MYYIYEIEIYETYKTENTIYTYETDTVTTRL